MLNSINAPARLPLLSQTAEHALRAVLYLGRNQERGLIAATEVAEALGAPPNYLAKTLRLLARRGVLKSLRGPHGGFALALPADAISAAQVVEAVDEVTARANCLLGNRACDPENPCEAHARWATLTRRVLQPMEETSIADILGSQARNHGR
jgi:Rrf2 family iron-sulfur cluster assembly transcriptional regulator